jgi:catechol 2,3-dioxygenase-like lactoylglutathione lyase family enzyme
MDNEPQFGFVVEYVADMEAARRFFVQVLGLQVQRQSPEFIQFDHFAIASDRPLAGNGEPELYWLVDDAETVYRELSEKAKVTLPLRQMPFGKVFGIQDPDGYPHYLLELAQNRPSQPVRRV